MGTAEYNLVVVVLAAGTGFRMALAEVMVDVAIIVVSVLALDVNVVYTSGLRS